METGRPYRSLAGNAGFLLSRVGTAVQTGFKEVLGRWQVRPLQFAILMTLGSAAKPPSSSCARRSGLTAGTWSSWSTAWRRWGTPSGAAIRVTAGGTCSP